MKLTLILLLIPFLTAVGHDIWFNYFSDDMKIREVKRGNIDLESYQLSDTGWIWHNYSKGSLNVVRDSFSPQTWQKFIDPVLELPMMVVSVIPFLIFSLFFIIIYITTNKTNFHFGSMRRKKDDDFTVYSHAKSNAMKYKKK